MRSHKIYWDLTRSHKIYWQNIFEIWYLTFYFWHLTFDIYWDLTRSTDLSFYIWYLTCHGIPWHSMTFDIWHLTCDIWHDWRHWCSWYWHNPISFSLMDSQGLSAIFKKGLTDSLNNIGLRDASASKNMWVIFVGVRAGVRDTTLDPLIPWWGPED